MKIIQVLETPDEVIHYVLNNDNVQLKIRVAMSHRPEPVIINDKGVCTGDVHISTSVTMQSVIDVLMGMVNKESNTDDKNTGVWHEFTGDDKPGLYNLTITATHVEDDMSTEVIWGKLQHYSNANFILTCHGCGLQRECKLWKDKAVCYPCFIREV